MVVLYVRSILEPNFKFQGEKCKDILYFLQIWGVLETQSVWRLRAYCDVFTTEFNVF